MHFLEKIKEGIGPNLLILGILIWFSGLAGRDLYLVPVLVGIIIITYQVLHEKSFQQIFGQRSLNVTYLTSRKLLFLLLFHGLILISTTVFKLYSFQWNIWDVGIYSDILFNTSKGIFYSSYNLNHNWGDHFTPSMSFISLFYLIYSSSNWMTLSKVFALIISPFFIWKICDNVFTKKNEVYFVGLLLSLFWLFFYAPIVNSSYFAFHPSSLAAPAIFYSFLCLQRKEWWKMFFIFFIFNRIKGTFG